MNFPGLDLNPCLCPLAVAVINAETGEQRVIKQPHNKDKLS